VTNREVYVLEEKGADHRRLIFEQASEAQTCLAMWLAGDVDCHVVRYVPAEFATASQIDILNSNILALIELLTYDGVKYRGEGSVLVGEKLDEYRERTGK
jgi:hypothetical protein